MTDRVRLQEAFKLALSLVLFYWLALYMDWDLPEFGAMAMVVTSMSTTGASMGKGVMRVAGTGLGALAGFVLLSWFSQSPGGMLIAVAVYLVFVGYFMQVSRQGDTWFNAGFLAVAVWSSSYMQVDTAFHFATNRFLETTAGVLLYTLVSAVFWPRTSKALLQRQGRALWENMHKLFLLYRRQLENNGDSSGAAELRSGMAGDYQQFLATLDAAYYDSYVVRSRKKCWEALRMHMRMFSNAQELWRESLDDCNQLDLKVLLPELDNMLDTLSRRLQLGGRLWQSRASGEAGNEYSFDTLLNELQLAIDPVAGDRLSHFDHAALMNLVSQFRQLDRSSADLLQTLRLLANPDCSNQAAVTVLPEDPYQASWWSPERLLKAVFPALCWVVAYLFWIYVNPPGGPSIAMMGAAFGLMMLMAPANLFALLIVLLLSMFVAVAPVYLLIMPLLDSGFALLVLVFVYVFIFTWLGGISPVLKLGPLAMFVMVVNINNDQVYSFMLLVSAGLVMLLGVSTVVVVHRLLSPMHPEKVLLRSIHRFLNGCAEVVESFRLPVPKSPTRVRRARKRVFETAVLPLSGQLLNLKNNLDYELFPDNTPDRVDALVDSLQSVRLRLLSLDANWERALQESPGLLQILVPLSENWSQRIQQQFSELLRLERTGRLDREWRSHSNLSQELEQWISEVKRGRYDDIDDHALQYLYALSGGIQSLLTAMGALRTSMEEINWVQWSAARF